MNGTAPPRAPRAVRRFRRRLLAFFRDRKRDLPWRKEEDPYRILVSEVMLQQTRVEAVIPYYRRWLERFPDLDALAEADLDEVLELWTGLGYYARARNLHRAARIVRERHGGRLPAGVDGLRELPGVGEYTAGAVASIAFGVPAPAVDGNARRVLARLYDDPGPSAARLRGWASALVDPEAPGDFNQALMELGSTVCLPRSPGCGRCPVDEHCLAHARGTPEERPAPRERPPPKEMRVGVAVLLRNGEEGPNVLLRRRPKHGLLGGTWEFPGEEAAKGEREEEAAVRAASSVGSPTAGPGERLGVVEHRFSHREARYHAYLFRVDGGLGPGGADSARTWLGLDDLPEFPLPAAQGRIREQLMERAEVPAGETSTPDTTLAQ